MEAGRERKDPITGHWLFVCNPNRWAVDEWLGFGEQEILYKVSKNHSGFIKPGHQGLLRVGKDQRSKANRAGRPHLEVGIYAWVKAVDEPTVRSDPDLRGYYHREDATEPTWRVKLKILNNMLKKPVLASLLPNEQRFRYIHRPLQSSTLPLDESALRYILNFSGLKAEAAKTQADTVDGITRLESEFERSTPREIQKISGYIERGRIGQELKRLRKGKCQICKALGRDEVAFLDCKGHPFSEAHHVVPVSSRMTGSLSRLNVMILCPNHHRQAHYGKFNVIEDGDLSWKIQIDDGVFDIRKATLTDEGGG